MIIFNRLISYNRDNQGYLQLTVEPRHDKKGVLMNTISDQRGNMKPASITFKTSEENKHILEKLAQENFRSLSQQCEMIIVKWMQAEGLLKKKKK